MKLIAALLLIAIPTASAEEILYDDIIVVDSDGSRSIRRPAFYEGKYRTPLEGADFYRAVDRPDLAESYRTRNAVHWALGLGGLVVAMGGGAYMLSGMNFGACDDLELLTPAYQACAARADDERTTKATIGLGIAAVGSVAFFVGAFIDPHPVDAPTRRRLADEHNRKLGVTPLVGPGVGGVQLDGRF